VFAASFDLAAAEAVGGSGAIDVLEVAGLLGSLVDKSLVVADPGGTGLRYRLLETIRLFAAERLADIGPEHAAAARAAHRAHYLALAEAAAPHLADPEQSSWLARLDADQANLRRAAEHAAGEPDGTSRVLRFGVALERYWAVRYRNEEAAGLLVPVLSRPEAAADPRAVRRSAGRRRALDYARGPARKPPARREGGRDRRRARQRPALHLVARNAVRGV
jgi:predicted ATPase